MTLDKIFSAIPLSHQLMNKAIQATRIDLVGEIGCVEPGPKIGAGIERLVREIDDLSRLRHGRVPKSYALWTCKLNEELSPRPSCSAVGRMRDGIESSLRARLIQHIVAVTDWHAQVPPRIARDLVDLVEYIDVGAGLVEVVVRVPNVVTCRCTRSEPSGFAYECRL